MVLFQAEGQHYAVDCSYVHEIIPLVSIEPIPTSQSHVVGFITFAGQPLTVLDFTQMIAGKPSATYLSTRILLFREENASQPKLPFGLIVEKAIELENIEAEAFVPMQLQVNELIYLDGIANIGGRAIQKVDVSKLFIFFKPGLRPSIMADE